MLRVQSIQSEGKIISRAKCALALGLIGLASACGGADYTDSADESVQESDRGVEGDVAVEPVETESSELGTSSQAFSFFDYFGFSSSCQDKGGTNSVMAALAASTAIELKRWQPGTDFSVSSGTLKLSATGKAQCADGKCWNTQALLDLQSAPNGVQIRTGTTLDPRALKSALTSNYNSQARNWLSYFAPAHRFELLYSAPGGCDQYYWFKTTTPTGTSLTSKALNSIESKLLWVDGDKNPYVKFEVDGTMVGIDPTYGLNEVGSTSTGSCSAACAKISSKDVRGTCCSCNSAVKTYARSAWSATTYLCQ